MVADSVLSVILSVDSSPASVKGKTAKGGWWYLKSQY
jgi:hypothetical protein